MNLPIERLIYTNIQQHTDVSACTAVDHPSALGMTQVSITGPGSMQRVPQKGMTKVFRE